MSGVDWTKSFDPEAFTAIAAQIGHGGALGISHVGHGADWVELALDYREELIGVAGTGVIASGPIISLMDMATSMATWVKLGRFRHPRRLAAASSGAANAIAPPAMSPSSAASRTTVIPPTWSPTSPARSWRPPRVRTQYRQWSGSSGAGIEYGP